MFLKDFGDFERATSSEGVALLRDEAASRGLRPLEYVNDLRRRMSSTAIFHAVMSLGVYVEPRDRVTGRDPQRRASKAFGVGAVLGLRIVAKYTEIPAHRHMQSLVKSFAISSGDDKAEQEHLLGKLIVDQAERGYRTAEAYDGLVDDWMDELCPEVMSQPYVKRGFGYNFYLMEAVHSYMRREQDIVEVEHAIAEGIDWDAGLAGLLDE